MIWRAVVLRGVDENVRLLQARRIARPAGPYPRARRRSVLPSPARADVTSVLARPAALQPFEAVRKTPRKSAGPGYSPNQRLRSHGRPTRAKQCTPELLDALRARPLYLSAPPPPNTTSTRRAH